MRKEKFEAKLQRILDEAQAIIEDGGPLTIKILARHVQMGESTLYKPQYQEPLRKKFPQLNENHPQDPKAENESLKHKLKETQNRYKTKCQAYVHLQEKYEREKVRAKKYEEMYYELLTKYQELAESKIKQF